MTTHAPPERLGESEALREKLDTARRQRLLNQKLSGKSLGEQLGGEELDSSAAWVAKSRRQETERKEATARKPKRKARPAGTSDRFDEMDEEVQGQSQVAGAQLSHSLDDFKEGEEVTLTLADQNILDGDEVNDDEELLENVNLAADQRRERKKELASGAKYDPFGGDSAILQKYDHEEKVANREKLTLDASGAVNVAKAQRLAEIKSRLQQTAQGADSGATRYDLGGDARSAGEANQLGGGSAGDYMTTAEAEAAGHFKKSGGKGKRTRRKPKGDKLDLDALQAEAGAADRGTRAEREARAGERAGAAEAELAARTQNFDRALAAREGQVARKLGDGAAPMEVAEEEEEVEVDAELQAALARARRLQDTGGGSRHQDDAAQRLAAQVMANAARKGSEVEEGTELSSIEFSETGEFCKAVRSKDEGEADVKESLPSARYKEFKAEAERQLEEGGELGGAASMVPKREKKAKMDEGEEAEDEDDEDDEDEDEDEDEELEAKVAMLHERSTGGGMAGALEVLRGRGLLAEEAATSGRMFDQKGAGLENYKEEGEASFNLDYHDEYGRKMTQKQAFRQLSWKFHGKGPSKKRREKRIINPHPHPRPRPSPDPSPRPSPGPDRSPDPKPKAPPSTLAPTNRKASPRTRPPSVRRREKRMMEMEKQMDGKGRDVGMEYMGVLAKAQEKTKSAHVVLSGVNAIRPSDVIKPKQPLDRAKGARKKPRQATPASSGFDTTVNTMMGLSSAIPL